VILWLDFLKVLSKSMGSRRKPGESLRAEAKRALHAEPGKGNLIPVGNVVQEKWQEKRNVEAANP